MPDASNDVQRTRLVLDQIHSMHRQSFTPIRRTIVGVDRLPWFSVVLGQAEKESLSATRLFDRAGRAAARVHARELAEERAAELLARASAERTRKQRDADDLYAAANSSDDDRLLVALQTLTAHRNQQLPVMAVVGQRASVGVYMDSDAMVPYRKPVLSTAGNWTLPKATKTERAAWVRELAAAHALLAAKEVQAAAPGIATTAVEVRDIAKGSSPVLRVVLARADLGSANWGLSAWEILAHLDPAYEAKQHGRTGELRPL